MTTIALNKNVIASDLQFTHGSGHKFKGSTKIHQIYNPIVYPKPFYIGFAGGASECQAVISWLMTTDGKPPKVKGSEFVVLAQDKKMFTFMDPTNWIEISEPYYAIGSGMQYAIGAMAAGADPLSAVKVAAKHDSNTGQGFKHFSFEQKKKPAQGGLNLVAEE